MKTQKAEGNNAQPNLDELLKNAPEGATIAANDWGKLGTYDKVNWLMASYNKANAQGAQDGGSEGGSPKIDVEKPAAKAEDKKEAKKDDETPKVNAGDASSNEVAAKLDQVLALVNGVATKVDAVDGKVAKLEAAQTAQAARLDEVAQKSEAVSTKINAVVAAPATPADNMPKGTETVKKSDPRTGCFDTAFLPGRGRR